MKIQPLRPCLIGAVSLALSAFTLHGKEANPPNFVIILADDLGYGDVGYQGGEVPTPQIDSIAKSGIKFTDGYVTCPVCAPSRGGLLTGRYQQSFGFWDNIGPYRVNKDVEPGIPVDLPIISERLKKLGYTCGLFGKTHDGDAEGMQAFNRWDEYYGFNNGASNYLGDMNRPHNPIFHNKKIVSHPYSKRGIKNSDVNKEGILVKDTQNYLTDKLGDMAVKFIDANKEKPFLCYIPFNAIHGPFQAPKALVRKYPLSAAAKADVEVAEIEKKRRLVKAMLCSMDKNVGKVLNALKRNGLEKNTIVIFLSDNGGHEASSNGPLRGKKGTYWEGGLRVPFCIQWKGHLKGGQTYRQPVISLDILPTLITAAGGKVDPSWKLDGVDLLPYLTGEKKSPPHDTLYWVWGARKAMRSGDLKIVSLNRGKSYQMYDLSKDIGEQHDIAQNHPEKLKEMIKQHQQWESGLMSQQWGWDSRLGYKDPQFGKPRPYHNPKYQIK